MNDLIFKKSSSRICRRFYILIIVVHAPIECELVSEFPNGDKRSEDFVSLALNLKNITYSIKPVNLLKNETVCFFHHLFPSSSMCLIWYLIVER